MRYLRLLAARVLLVVVTGCGQSRPAPIPMETSEYAKQLKANVLRFVQAGKENPKAIAGRAEIFLETLQDHTRRTVDENKPVYEELVRKCKEVVDTSQGSGDVKKKLDEMATLANKLPG